MRNKTKNRLEKKADKLYQIMLIRLKPLSTISGNPTEVIHHFIPKSQSNYLRYDEKNGIPLTHTEHARHHLSGDPSIIAKILQVNGQEWYDDLQKRRLIKCKLNIGFLKETIERLEVL